MTAKPVARVGDTHVCPLHGPNPIVTGAPDTPVNNRPVARVGDQTACGAVILTGAPSFGIGVLVAHVGSATSHGGVITTGSPDTLVGVPEAPAPVIDDPPLEPVPILPMEAAAQALAELAESLKTEGLGLGVIAGALVGGVTRGIGNKLPVGKAIEQAAQDSRSAGEAMGKAGMGQAKERLDLKTDDKYIDRYHGPDDLARDGQGKLAEIEAKGANRDSIGMVKNKYKESQSSRAKNARRATQMVRNKSKKIDQPSGRQGGTYTRGEIDLWQEITDDGGKKRHLSVHTNTETGRVRVFERDTKGKIDRTLDDFMMDGFNEIKRGIGRLFGK